MLYKRLWNGLGRTLTCCRYIGWIGERRPRFQICVRHVLIACRNAPAKEVMKALNDVIEKGWVRYVGASSMAAWEFQKYVCLNHEQK